MRRLQGCYNGAMKHYLLYVNSEGTPIGTSQQSEEVNDACTFTMTEAFLKAYLEYLQRIKTQNPGKNFVVELCIPLDSKTKILPGLAIVEAKE